MQRLLTGCSSFPLFLEAVSNLGHKAQLNKKVPRSGIKLSPDISDFDLQRISSHHSLRISRKTR